MPSVARFAVLAAALSVASPAFAQWYAGGTAGASRASLDSGRIADQFLDLGFDAAQGRMDDDATGARLFGGYRFHRHFAAEAGAFDLGKFTVGADVQPPGSLDAKIRSRGGDLSVLALWGLTDAATGREWLAGFVRAGAYAARTKADYSASGSVMLAGDSASQSKRTSGLVLGAGVLVQATERIAVRVEWARYDKLGDDLTGGEFDARVISAGIQYRF